MGLSASHNSEKEMDLWLLMSGLGGLLGIMSGDPFGSESEESEYWIALIFVFLLPLSIPLWLFLPFPIGLVSLAVLISFLFLVVDAFVVVVAGGVGRGLSNISEYNAVKGEGGVPILHHHFYLALRQQIALSLLYICVSGHCVKIIEIMYIYIYQISYISQYCNCNM